MRPNCYCFPVSVGHIQPNTNNPENKQQSKIFLNVFPKNQFESSFIYAAFLFIIYALIEIFVICMCSQSKSHGYRMSVMWGKDAIRWAGITHQWDHASNTPKFENVAAIEYLPKDVSIFSMYILTDLLKLFYWTEAFGPKYAKECIELRLTALRTKCLRLW